jgi:fatty acid desaturase
MHIIGLWLLANGWTAPAILILGIAQGRCGWLMHEGGHYSLTGNIPIDRFIQILSYGLGDGMSASWWRSQHNRHHAMPQRLKHDVDLDTLPLVAFNVEIGKKGAPAWLRLQAYLFSPLTCLLVGLGWQFFLHPRHAFRNKQHLELVCFAVRYIFIGIFGWALGFSVGKIILLYVLYVWVGAAYIFTNFALSHTHTPVLQPNETLDWVRYASNHTVNIEPVFWVDWWMGYLNYQIEHHLFPSMPQYRNREASIRVRELFAKYGLEYKVLSYVEALKVTTANLDQVGREVSLSQKQKKIT